MIKIKENKVGSLRRALGIAKGENIPHSKLKIKEGDSAIMKKKKTFAMNASKWDHAMGGELSSVMGMASPYVAAAGIASDLIFTAIENASKPADQRNYSNNVNPYGLAMGGNLTKANIEGGETISDVERGSSLYIAKGPKHEQGGIDIMADGGTVKSDRIGYDKQGHITTNPDYVKTTFANLDKKIAAKLKGKNDPVSNRTRELMLKKTETDNGTIASLLDKIEEYKCGGKMKKYQYGTPLEGEPDYQARLAQFQYLRDNPGATLPNSLYPSTLNGPTQPALTGIDSNKAASFAFKNQSVNPNSVESSAYPILNLWGEGQGEAYDVSKDTKLPRKPLTPMDGEQMSQFGALAGGAYSMLEGLISRPEKERPRTINTRFQKNYYNPSEEQSANRVALNTVLRGMSGSSTDRTNKLAALSGFQTSESNIARRKFNIDSEIDQRENAFNLQKDSSNAQILAGTDLANSQNRAQTRNLRRQGIGNMLQSVANVGDYKNRQTEQKMKIALLDDLFANYGVSADSVPALMKLLLEGNFYKG